MIMMIQEVWPHRNHESHLRVNNLQTMHKNYKAYGTSSSDIDAEIDILHTMAQIGFVKPRFEYKHKGVTLIDINSNIEVLLINVNFPFYNILNLAKQKREYCDTIDVKQF